MSGSPAILSSDSVEVYAAGVINKVNLEDAISGMMDSADYAITGNLIYLNFSRDPANLDFHI